MKKIAFAILAVGLFVLGWELHPVIVHASGLSRVQQVIVPSSRYDKSLVDITTGQSVYGDVKGFACMEDACYVVVQ